MKTSPYKVVILAGGLGTRLSEETSTKPKPLVEIGGKPILWHIMKLYSHHGFNDFIVCVGYKGYLIKEFFSNYFLHTSDVTFDFTTNSVDYLERRAEPWRVTVVDTGNDSMTGGRLRRIKQYVSADDCFLMTYGDGVSDVDVSKSVAFHLAQGRLATVTAVSPPGRFGSLSVSADRVDGFQEKPDGDGHLINGGFFVLSPKVLDFIEGDLTVWEQGPLETLAAKGQLGAYPHRGFWQPMDTLRDKQSLEKLWAVGAPWKVWDDK